MYGLFGLTYGLATLMRRRGVPLLGSENDTFTALDELYGSDSREMRLLRAAFGLGDEFMRARALAGLELYARLAEAWQDGSADASIALSIAGEIRAEFHISS